MLLVGVSEHSEHCNIPSAAFRSKLLSCVSWYVWFSGDKSEFIEMFFDGSGKVTSNSDDTSISGLHAPLSSRLAPEFETFSLSHFSLVRWTTAESSVTFDTLAGLWVFFRVGGAFEVSFADDVGDGVLTGDAFDICSLLQGGKLLGSKW